MKVDCRVWEPNEEDNGTWFVVHEDGEQRLGPFPEAEAERVADEQNDLEPPDFSQCEDGKCGQCDGCVTAADDRWHYLHEEGLI